jgi:putative ABC transport system permease protein
MIANKQYIKQAWQLLRENPLISCLTMLGTALSVAMIMVLVLVYQVKTTSYAPVSNRGRILYITIIEGAKIGESARWWGDLGQRITRECFYPMQTPEAVTAVSSETKVMRSAAPGVKLVRESEVRLTDAAFWQVFDFRFLDGAPYTEEMFHAATPVAIVSETVARAFFGRTDVTGETIQLDFVDYAIRGVAANVSKVADEAYGEIWIPYSTSQSLANSEGAEGICGSLQVCILARSRSDFKAIRREVQQRLEAFNAGQKEFTANVWKQPVTSVDRMFYNVTQDRAHGNVSGMLMLAVLFLLLPVFNLLGIVFSQMQKRRPEIGIRKAFGADTRHIVVQILWENLFVTLAGGVVGLGLSFLFFYVAKDGLLEQTDVRLQAGMFVQPLLFISAVGTCLVINLLSAGIPAWRTARKTVIDSLNANIN